MQAILLTVAWVALVLLRSLKFKTSSLTHFELHRRLAAHDETARELVEREQKLPLIAALQLLVVGLVAVLVVALASAYLGLITGPLLSLVMLYVAELASSRHIVQRWSYALLGRFEPQFARVATALSVVLVPLVSLRETAAGPSFYSKDELSNLIKADKTVLTPDEKTLFLRGLTFEGITIADVMTPRSVIDAVDVNETLGPVVLDRLHKTGHSRFPVIDRDVDHVVGMLFLHDLVPLDPKLKRVRDAMNRHVYYVHQDRNLDHALHAFLRTKHHLFIVVNDFSEVVGLITIEDCLEQILGRKIVDEFDAYDDLRAVAAKAASKKPQTGEVV